MSLGKPVARAVGGLTSCAKVSALARNFVALANVYQGLDPGVLWAPETQYRDRFGPSMIERRMQNAVSMPPMLAMALIQVAEPLREKTDGLDARRRGVPPKDSNSVVSATKSADTGASPGRKP